MQDVPRISDAEWEVMKLVWASPSPIGAAEMIEALGEKTGWKPKTIKSLISRLLKKQALHYEQDGRAYRYYALITEAESVRAESQSFLARVFGGSLTPMLAHFMEDKQLTTQEIEELKRILEKKER